MRRHRLLTVGALATLVAALVAGPVSAGGPTTWYVDDDGTAGAAGCNGGITVPTSIQDAIDASGQGDTILVCRGLYPEALDIQGSTHRGLTIRAVEKWQARVNPSTGFIGTGDDDAIVRVASRNVRIQWLRVVAPTLATCDEVEYGIQVDGVKGAVIRANRVVAQEGGDARNGACGMVMGIAVRDGASGALVTHNLVRNFKSFGIQVHGSTANVTRNSIRFWHPLLCATVACASGQPAFVPLGIGIRVYQGSGRVTGNAISSTVGAVDDVDVLDYGITAFASDPGLVVSNNLVRRAQSGIYIDGLSGATVEDNDVTSDAPIGVGIHLLDVTGSQVLGNEVHGFTLGLSVSSASTGNTLTGNNALGNSTRDCQDLSGDTLPAGPAPNLIDNTWTDNLGNADQPAGLCADLF